MEDDELEESSRPFWKVENIDGLSSMSEVASCSYEARAAGVRNGMFLGPALQLCPQLRTIPYDFPGYEEVSRILYDTVASYTLDIQAGFHPVLWIRIQFGSVFRTFVDPYSEYGSGSTRANTRINKRQKMKD